MIGATDHTRDFLLTDIPWDGNNISRVEVDVFVGNLDEAIDPTGSAC